MKTTADQEVRKPAPVWHQRFRTAIATVLVLVPVSLLLFFFYPEFSDFVQVYAILGVIAATVGFAIIRYLETGFKVGSSPELASIHYKAELQQFKREMETRLSHAEGQVELSSLNISDSQRTDLVLRLRKSIEESAKGKILDEIRDSLRENQAQQKLNSELEDRYEYTIRRFNLELAALSRRGNLNLGLGIITAVAGIVLLGLFVQTIKSSSGAGLAFIENFVPRVSLVILIEVFAYFFLRLYSTSLMEIKYFQNEITNVEAKFVALKVATHTGDEKIVGEVISQLAQTERNYILQKGQTTVDLERSRMDKEKITSLADNLMEAFSRNRQS